MGAKKRQKAAAKGRQSHPKGPISTVDDAWKKRLTDAMAEQSPPWDQKTLAKKVGVSRASISGLFRPGLSQIRYKERIHELFGWESASRSDEVRTRIDSHWVMLTDEDRDLVAQFVERLAGKP